jgi:hypothetical protein
MKRLFTIIVPIAIGIILTAGLFAQAPQKMSYQCVIRNSDGNLVANQSVGIRITILQGTPLGTVVYQETYSPNPQTNSNGLVSIEIGGGIPITGTFSAINWAAGPYFLKTETDPTGGTTFTISGTSQLLSVPYSLYAKTAGTADYNALTNLPALNIANWNTAYGWGNHAGLYRPVSWVPAWGDVTGKPGYATVATSGSYNDLLNKPIILNSQWTTSGSNIYYTTGWVSIGTASSVNPLTISNANNTCYINLFDNQGTGGMRLGAYIGSMGFINDNINKNIFFTTRNASGYDQRLTISGTTGNIGIGDASPDASLAVQGTVKIGSNGKIFSELTEVTGTTGVASSYYVAAAYPAGYTRTNTRVLSVEINASGDVWVGLGFTNNVPDDVPISYNLSTSMIYVFYPNSSVFQSKNFRMLLMKVE